MTIEPQKPVGSGQNDIVLVRPFTFDDAGELIVYLIDDPRLPAAEHYFIKSKWKWNNPTGALTDGGKLVWIAHRGPEPCFEKREGTIHEAIDHCFEHAKGGA